MMRPFQDAASVRRFALAGNARLTIRSLRTGVRFTYRIKLAPKGKRGRPWFVSVLTGPDNNESFQYMGNIEGPDGLIYKHGLGRGKIKRDAPSAVAWFFFAKNVLREGKIPDLLEVWHEGKCGRCGRALTVPESIESGIGPECREKQHG